MIDTPLETLDSLEMFNCIISMVLIYKWFVWPELSDMSVAVILASLCAISGFITTKILGILWIKIKRKYNIEDGDYR